MRSPSSAPSCCGRLLLLTVAIVLLASASAGAAQDDVTIVPSDGGSGRSLALADVATDVGDRTYALRAADGSTSSVAVTGGVSVAALVHAAGLDGDPYTHVEIAREDGGSALLLADDLGGTGEGPPVVWSDEQGVHFLRPSDGDRDVNASDLARTPDGPLVLTLRTGDPVKPQASVSTLRARVGARVSFSASLAAGTLRPGWGYSWYFDGGAGVPGTSVVHRFREVATFTVLLNVVRADGVTTVGLPDKVDVTIVPARRARRDERAARRSDEGAAGTGSAVSGGGGGSGTAAGGTVAPVAPAPPAPSAAPRPAPEQPTAAPPAEPRGELVSGTLLAAVGDSPASFAGGSRPGETAQAAERDAPLDIPVGAWVAIGLAALLMLGWALESRHTVPFWQP